jgi:hypothetical protein
MPSLRALPTTFLVKRADRDAAEPDGYRHPGKRRRFTARGLVPQHQINANQPSASHCRAPTRSPNQWLQADEQRL